MSRWVKLMLCLVLLGCAHDPRAGLAFMNEGPARRVAIEPFVGGGEIEGLALPLREAGGRAPSTDQPHGDQSADRRHPASG